MSRRWPRIASGAVALVLACVAVVGTSVATGASPIRAATEATELTLTARSLAEQLLVVAGGGLLVGVGLGVVAASGLTYWYKNRQIGGRLR